MFYNDIEQQTWLSSMHNDNRKDTRQRNKLRTLRKFKLTHDYESYLTNVTNVEHRIALTKLRLSNHSLAIETGRYAKPYQAPNERICQVCKDGVEDEEHFMVKCEAYEEQRKGLYDYIKSNTKVTLDTVAPETVLLKILKSHQKGNVQKQIAKFTWECTRMRTELIEKQT